MDVTITLKDKHDGEPIEIEAIGCSVHEERQTYWEPGSLDIDYEDVIVTDDDGVGLGSLTDELRELYRDEIGTAIYEAWNDRSEY
jgi:hypothetical protein